ncbi:MAG: response regulator [Deltaproteobacteria bacterium]|nr:response regulator [Deltaproteobacteria bacterium]
MNEKVLLVDDEVEFLEAMSERLRLRDMEVKTATNAEDALAMLGEEQFDAVFLDLQMPGTDGIKGLKMIKNMNPNLQVIFLTGHATVEKGIQAMKLGAMDFMEKPVDINVLSEKIHKAKARKMLLVGKEAEARISEILSSKTW